MEKRTSQRHETKTSITCRYFTTRSDNRAIGGNVLNFGERGLYAELNTPLRRGTILLIRTLSGASSSRGLQSGEGFRSFSLAEVRWSKPVPDNAPKCYGTGMKYF